MPPSPGPVAGLLFTGGASRRMGRDKAAIEVDGRTLAERGADMLEAVCAPVLEVGPGFSRLPAVREEPPGDGPLAALGAGWVELQRLGYRGPVIALAVDMPHVTPALLRFLAEYPGGGTAVPRWEDYPQPLSARYSPETLDVALALLAGGERKLRVLIEVTEPAWIEPQEWAPVAGTAAFEDLDTPEDLRRFEAES